MRARAVGLLSFVLATAALPAAAQPRDAAGAEVLYRAGREAARRGDWATACAKLAESQRLDPAPGTLLNLADCEEHRGHLAQAWQEFVQAQSQLPKGDSRGPYAKSRADAVEKRLPHLSVRLEAGVPAGTHVVRDDQELGAASLGVSMPVDPGDHVLLARADGHIDGRAQVTLAEGESREITLALGPLSTVTPAVPVARPAIGAPATMPAPPTTYTPVVPPEKKGAPTFAYALLGVGAVGIGVGTVAGVLALSRAGTVKDACGPDYKTCTPASVDAAKDGKTFTTASTIGFVAGAVFAGAGLYFLLAPSSSSKTALTVAPNGAALSGAF